MKTFKHLLIELNACREAVKWAEDKSIEEVVELCHRGDWLLWLAQEIDIALKPLILAKGHCANTVRHLMNEERSIKALDTVIAFGEGKATCGELDYASAFHYINVAVYTSVSAASAYASEEIKKKTSDICRKYIGDLIINKVNELIK